jgi:hypothetical protein
MRGRTFTKSKKVVLFDWCWTCFHKRLFTSFIPLNRIDNSVLSMDTIKTPMDIIDDEDMLSDTGVDV